MSAASGAVPRLAQVSDKPGHRRNKSAQQVLKSIIPTKGHKKAASNGPAVYEYAGREANPPSSRGSRPQPVPLLPPDHPHSSGARVLGEIRNPSGSPPARPYNMKDTRPGSYHKKTFSSVSLRSMGKDNGEAGGSKRSTKESPKKPGKTKSSLGLAAVFSKNRSQKDLHENVSPRDKENTTPPSSVRAQEHTPIWAQFRTTPYEEVSTTSSIPLNDRRSVEEEIALYTPKEYSPSKQRNFHGVQPPTLQKRPPNRPQSMFLPASASTTSLLENISRKISGERDHDRAPSSRGSTAQKPLSAQKPGLRRASSERRAVSDVAPKPPAPTSRTRGSRVMAAVAAINGRTSKEEEKLDPAVIAAQFEAVLDSRNIPETMRPKMRALADTVKADFIKKNRTEQPESSPQKTATSKLAAVAQTMSRRVPTFGRQNKASNDGEADEDQASNGSIDTTSKRHRRSRTFTFSKADSSIKKKQDGWSSARSSKSIDLPKSPSVRSFSSASSSKGANGAQKAAQPQEFVDYLRRVQKPQDVEVGKLHKLRILLRNETVAWVDSFIEQGGMMELVALLNRIMEIEWREEHEDTLFHEILLCLKGLSTTDRALSKLCDIEATFFPRLLGMLFDEEHKGPSEFTTRGLIVNLLFAHLCAGRSGDLAGRARTVLGYMKDPVPEEDRRPLPFILEMHQPRPYKIWCREITNVTKEVFWIFLHHLNVIPLPEISRNEDNETTSSGSSTGSRPSTSSRRSQSDYFAVHFPQPRPPVPAAPYVGGVEWDATNYLSTHLDLMNGIIAALPTREERNALRTELKASGFEKVMGNALRTCKEKFYGSVHDGLKTWVKAALEDGWDVKSVRMGLQDGASSPVKAQARGGAASPKKKNEPAPKLELPQLSLGNPARKSSEIKDEWIGV